jgi:hypothetical protein
MSIMNKLKEYRDKQGEKYNEFPFEGLELFAFNQGFDTMVELDLPIRFGAWKDGLDDEQVLEILGKGVILYEDVIYQNKLLYEYWLEHKFKID